jgi:hypothetical protein
MRTLLPKSSRRTLTSCALLAGALLPPFNAAPAQGCMPIRYTSPNVTGKDNSYLNDNSWQFGLGYRWLHADRFYIGHTYRPEASPGGQPIEISIHTLNLSGTYAFTNRFSAGIEVPVVIGDESIVQGDGLRHSQSAGAIGDISVIANLWLLQPLEHANGNVSLSLGVKAPTGSHSRTDKAFSAPGVSTDQPVQTSIQPGDGGWGVILQGNAFQRVSRTLSVYAAGAYLVSPKSHTEVLQGVTPTAVPDEYSAHAGLAYAIAPKKGLSVSLGGRIDGIPVRDLVGGGDQFFRRPGYSIYAEPGISLTLAKSPFSRSGSTLSLSVPVAVDINREASVAEQRAGTRFGGDFASYLIFFNYSIRR